MAYPDTHTPNLYLGAPPGPFQDAVTLPIPTTFGNFLSPVAGPTPQLHLHNIPPAAPGSGFSSLTSVPMVPTAPHQLPIPTPTVRVKQEHCSSFQTVSTSI